MLTALRADETGLPRNALQAAAGLGDREHFTVEHLRPMLSAGLIEMTLPDRPRSSLQKYRITAKGKACLARNA